MQFCCQQFFLQHKEIPYPQVSSELTPCELFHLHLKYKENMVKN